MLKITDNASLRRLNTFGINATCDTLIEYTSAEDLADVKICGSFLNIGLGSNMLFVKPHYRGSLSADAMHIIKLIILMPSFTVFLILWKQRYGEF